MEDFAKFNELQKQKKAPEIQDAAIQQTGFIASRLNKDNFWNLMFFVGMVGSVAVSELIARKINFSLVLPITIPVIILISYLFARFMNKVQSNQELEKGKFIFGQTLLAISILTVAFIAFPFFFLEGKIVLKLLITNIVAWFILMPTLYCIIKNLPISFYFHKNAWYVEGRQTNQHTDQNRHESLASPKNMLTNPINSWYSGNIFHKK